MKTFCLIGIVLLLAGASAAQKIGKKEYSPAPLPGVIYGSIIFKKVSVANFPAPSCRDFEIRVGSNMAFWLRTANPYGTFASGQCQFKITDIPPRMKFAGVTVSYPFHLKPCDAEVLKQPSTSIPLIWELKYGQQLRHDPVITEFRCDVYL